MFGKAKRLPPDHIEAVVGSLTTLRGQLRADGTVRVDGVIEGGEIVSTGNVIITEHARVMADIQAQVVSIAGAYKGTITAERVELLAGSRVWGELRVRSFLLDEGGFFSGNLVMQAEVPEEPFVAEPLPPLESREKP